MDHKYKSLLQNIPTRHMIVKADTRNGVEQLQRLRQRDIFNYFILGRLSTIMSVLDSAEKCGYFDRQFAWHGITLVSSLLRLVTLHRGSTVLVGSWPPHIWEDS
jgi:ionotropic glutamate receptor